MSTGAYRQESKWHRVEWLSDSARGREKREMMTKGGVWYVVCTVDGLYSGSHIFS